MSNMQIRSSLRDLSLGFPVTLLDVPVLAKPSGDIPLVDSTAYQRRTALALAEKSTRLTGNEVRFLRLHAELTYQALANTLGVTHPAVKKWETSGGEATSMSWPTEVMLRMYVLSSHASGSRQFTAAMKRFFRGVYPEPASDEILEIAGDDIAMRDIEHIAG